jgi:hypothetical protein
MQVKMTKRTYLGWTIQPSEWKGWLFWPPAYHPSDDNGGRLEWAATLYGAKRAIKQRKETRD